MLKQNFKKIKRWLKYSPPFSLTSTGWRLFNEAFKENAPIRYWLNNDLFHIFVWPVERKIRKFNEYFYYRIKCRNHILNTGLNPGYRDFSDKMLHVSFNMLKDFVEIEKANMQRISTGMKYKSFFKRFKNAEYGIKYLEWEATLDDPTIPVQEQSIEQAKLAREILYLYNWWVIQRPARTEIHIREYIDQGLGISALFDDDFDKNADDYKQFREDYDRNEKLRDSWAIEDLEMLARLVNISQRLWT
jgi:hypothetical protein